MLVKYKPSAHINTFGFGLMLTGLHHRALLQPIGSGSVVFGWDPKKQKKKQHIPFTLGQISLGKKISLILNWWGCNAIYKCLLNWSEENIILPVLITRNVNLCPYWRELQPVEEVLYFYSIFPREGNKRKRGFMNFNLAVIYGKAE